jgi:hypothetical protein
MLVYYCQKQAPALAFFAGKDAKPTRRLYGVMFKLILLGTIHHDPRGLNRLVEDLYKLAPRTITVELSPYGLRYRLKNKRSLHERFLRGLHKIQGTVNLNMGELKKLLRSTGIGGIRALLDLPFEYKGAGFYCRSRGIPLYCVDISSLSMRLLSHVNELLSVENLKKVIAFEPETLQAAVTREYKLAEDVLLYGRQSPRSSLITADEEWKTREQIVANRVRKIVTKNPGRTIVHIGGWRHLVARQGTLFNLLEDLEPKRILLGHS